MDIENKVNFEVNNLKYKLEPGKMLTEIHSYTSKTELPGNTKMRCPSWA